MNSPVIMIIAAGLAGLTLGGAYFAGLWWTVRRTETARNPALWLTGSYLLRASLLAGGILMVGRHDWRYLIACLIGLLAARILACRCVTAPTTVDSHPLPSISTESEEGQTSCN